MSDYSKLKTLAENYIALIDSPDEDSWAEARDLYDDAADADTVLGLIKELEILKYDLQVAHSVINASKVKPC